jgi:hypothetical protein
MLTGDAVLAAERETGLANFPPTYPWSIEQAQEQRLD